MVGRKEDVFVDKLLTNRKARRAQKPVVGAQQAFSKGGEFIFKDCSNKKFISFYDKICIDSHNVKFSNILNLILLGEKLKLILPGGRGVQGPIWQSYFCGYVATPILN